MPMRIVPDMRATLARRTQVPLSAYRRTARSPGVSRSLDRVVSIPPGTRFAQTLALVGRQGRRHLVARFDARLEDLPAQLVDLELLIGDRGRVDRVGMEQLAQPVLLGLHLPHRVPALAAGLLAQRGKLLALVVGQVERGVAAHRPAATHHAGAGAVAAAHHAWAVAI